MIEVHVGSMGLEVIMGPVTENHVVPVHREMCEYTIIPSSPGPIEHLVPLNPRIPLNKVQVDSTVVIFSQIRV